MHKLATLGISVALLSVAACASAQGVDPVVARQAWLLVGKVEKANNVPKGLLLSMSLVESGRGLDGRVLPWPYTVGVNPTRTYKYDHKNKAFKKLDTLRRIGFKRVDLKVGDKIYKNVSSIRAEQLMGGIGEKVVSLKGRQFSKRFESPIIATSFVKGVLRQGYDNMDIGLMQINWHWHGDNFTSVEEAFDPIKNASYAVSYLRKHRQKKDWWNSVGRYHSGTEKYAKRYIRNVYAMYRRVHRITSNKNA